MELSAEEVWQECLQIIRDNISRQSFKTWFEPLKADKLVEEDNETRLTVKLPSRFYYEWLEEHYFGLLSKTIMKVLGPQGRLFYNIVIEKDDAETGYEGSSMQLPSRKPPGGHQPPHGTVGNSNNNNQQWGGSQPPRQNRQEPPRTHYPPQGFGNPATPPSPQSPFSNPFVIPGLKPAKIESNINKSYTFERFIEGDCNRLARSASLAIAQQPGATSFNPFLIYGGVGLGKTHLIQAIGNHILANNNSQTVLYISSERFTTEFVQAIQNNRVNEFSMYYRQIDLLIVDDVQFFGGKEKTQEEFFHIFNSLHQAGKQIILSADRPPRDISGIEERLLSRFQWGLTADVQAPEFETRIAILQRQAEDDGIHISRDVVEFVAHHIKSNIRELEGALIRLLAHATLHKREIDLNMAKEVLRDLIKDTRVNLTIDEIQRIACEYFNIPEDLVRGKTRKREVVQARQVAMYFSKQLTQHSLKTIGLHFGGRDHSTVIHANQSVEDQIDTDPKFSDTIEEIRQRLELRSR
ncbi:MAG: chromosomal replication initiator protein DnaA [Rhodothermales bacterium]